MWDIDKRRIVLAWRIIYYFVFYDLFHSYFVDLYISTRGTCKCFLYNFRIKYFYCLYILSHKCIFVYALFLLLVNYSIT